jgi:hypothetical protein
MSETDPVDNILPMSQEFRPEIITTYEISFPDRSPQITHIPPMEFGTTPSTLFVLRLLTPMTLAPGVTITSAEVSGTAVPLTDVSFTSEGIRFNPFTRTQVIPPFDTVVIRVTFSAPPYQSSGAFNRLIYAIL